MDETCDENKSHLPINEIPLPSSILSDGGKSYQSKLLELINEYLDILKLTTTLYHHHCDGQSERTIGTLKGMLRAFVNEKQIDWDQHLVKLSFAYNTSVLFVTTQTPFELMYCRKPKLPIDITMPPPQVEEPIRVLEEYEIMTDLGRT